MDKERLAKIKFSDKTKPFRKKISWFLAFVIVI